MAFVINRVSLAMPGVQYRKCLRHVGGVRKWYATAAPQTKLNTDKWKIREEEKISEFDIDAVVLEHVKTGAQYLHLASPDSNNAFSVNFRTTPMDSTGVAHILEHTTLCGSEKFPVRDPFMKMLNRSLATFMNAMTGPDYTLYPFSTCNQQDFCNLMSVYMDSVYRPLLRELDFLQEGWRLENDEIDDKNSPFVIKGVVFNEMKGAYSDSQQVFGQHLLNNLLPSHTYSHSSGGFPLKIPDLTWNQLKEFHASHYHPSNSRFFTYGNIPLETHLQKIDTWLDQFDRLPLDTRVPVEKRWTAPRRVDITCAPDPMNPNPAKQATVAVSYLLSDITDVRESFVLQVVGELLLGGPSSPFYRSLIAPGIGAGFSPVSGFDGHIRETTFTVGLQNIDPADTEKIVDIIDQTLTEVVADGFPADRVQAVLHSYELGLKHRSGNFGLNLIMGMTAFANHSTDPLSYLRINSTLEWFNKQVREDPEFLQKKVKEHLLDNRHKLIQAMQPDPDFAAKEEKQFEELESRLRSRMTPADQEAARAKSLQLLKLQNEDRTDDASCLPTLRVADDIPTAYTGTEVTRLQLAGGEVPVQVSCQPTNQVSYFRALLDTSHVPAELKPFLPLFASYITKLGAKHLNYQDLDTAIELTTGGLGSSVSVVEDPGSMSGLSEALLLTSHCLDRNIEGMFNLWSMIFQDLHLNDPQRVGTLVRMDASDTTNGIAHSGHAYAMGSSAATITPAARLKELYSGMQHVSLLNQLAANSGSPVDLLDKIKQIAALTLNRSRMRCALNTLPATATALTAATDRFLQELPLAEPTKTGSGGDVIDFQPVQQQIHHVVPFPINFTAQSCPTVPYTHPHYPPLRVLAALLSSKFLHPEIREKGGAYGGGATAGGGAFTYYSYRDPKNLETFSVYRRAGEWAAGESSYTQQDIDEAKLRVFQRLDEPVQPGYRGLRQFLTGVDDITFADHRRRVLAVTTQELRQVAATYLHEEAVTGKTLVGPAQTGLEDMGWTTRKAE